MSNARGILALDLAIKTGWAYGEDFQAPRYGMINLNPESEPVPLGKRNSRLAAFLEDFITISRPVLIIYEAPVPRQQTSARGLVYLAGIVEMIAEEQGVPVREAHVGEPRKMILGRSAFFARGDDGKVLRKANGKMVSETKNTVMAWARGRGWDPLTDDVADALCLLEYAHTLRRSRVMAGRAA